MFKLNVWSQEELNKQNINIFNQALDEQHLKMTTKVSQGSAGFFVKNIDAKLDAPVDTADITEVEMCELGDSHQGVPMVEQEEDTRVLTL